MSDRKNTNEEEIDLGCYTGIRLGYDYLDYSHWRIKEILKLYYDCSLVNRPVGYKGKRYPGFVEHYDIVFNPTGEVIISNVTLDQYRQLFARKGFPLHEPDNKRRKGAEAFLDAVRDLTDTKK